MADPARPPDDGSGPSGAALVVLLITAFATVIVAFGAREPIVAPKPKESEPPRTQVRAEAVPPQPAIDAGAPALAPPRRDAGMVTIGFGPRPQPPPQLIPLGRPLAGWDAGMAAEARVIPAAEVPRAEAKSEIVASDPPSRAGFEVLTSVTVEPARSAFPWSGKQVLTGRSGTMTWEVTEGGGDLIIVGIHPKWSVQHRCTRLGVPILTVKTVGKRSTRLTWTNEGVEFVYDVNANTPVIKISEKGLYDGDTLDARLAAMDLSGKKRREFRIIDTDKDNGDIVPMRAELESIETCPSGPCQHVKLRYTGFGAVFVAPWHYWYGAGSTRPYLRFEHEKEVFQAQP